MTRTRSVLLCTSVLVVGLLPAGSAAASLPAAAKHVVVTAENTTSGIDGYVRPAATISGTLTSVSGGVPLPFTTLRAYLGSTEVANGSTDGAGQYTIGGLAPSSTGYAVCVSGNFVSGGPSTTGYLGRCYTTAGWDGVHVPSTATRVPLAAGAHAVSIDIAVKSAGAISGRVTSGGGAGLSGVNVSLHNRGTGQNTGAYTDPTGHYTAVGLTTGHYTVCFNPQYSSQGATGFRPRCYQNVPWDGGAYPATATSVSATLGATHTGVNATLSAGGAIAGRVTLAANGHPMTNVGIEVFSASGHFLAFATTDTTGHYLVKNLATATGDRVCAAPGSFTATRRFDGKCWTSVAYHGGPLPAGTTAVAVHVGHTHHGVDFALNRRTLVFGSIAGTITESSGGTALANAHVSVFRSGGGFQGQVTTDALGHYTLANVPASATGYTVCADGAYAFSGVTPTPRAPRCYNDVPWNGVTVPNAAARLPLTTGQHRTGIDIALQIGGQISGTVYVYNFLDPALNVKVTLFTTSGRELAATYSDPTDGTYALQNISPGSYVVCFDGRFSLPTTYRPQCYDTVAWSGD